MRDHRLWVAGAEIDKVKVRIVGGGSPRHASAVQHRFDGGPTFRFRRSNFRVGVPAPLPLAGFRVVRLDIARYVKVVATDAGDHVITHHQRRGAGKVKQVGIADRFVPTLLAVLHVERHQIAVRRDEEEPFAGGGHAAVADMDAAARRPGEVPQLTACARVNRPHMIGNREEHDAVHHHGCGLDRSRKRPAAGGVHPVYPGQAQRGDVVSRDAGERAEAAS